MTELKNKTVFITGASSGIGEACAHSFAAAGAKLILTSRREEILAKLTENIINKYDVKAIYRVMNVCDRESIKRTLASLTEDFKNIDILINNAGLALGTDKFQESNMDEWDEVIDTNIKGAFACARLILNIMLARKSGHIINLGSIAGHEVYPGGSVYCATKHAINAFTRALRLDLCGSGIRVSTIDPGMVETNFSVTRYRGDKNKAEKVYENMNPLTAEDIADAAVFCASRPPRVNISEIILMPADQASATMVHRSEA